MTPHSMSFFILIASLFFSKSLADIPMTWGTAWAQADSCARSCALIITSSFRNSIGCLAENAAACMCTLGPMSTMGASAEACALKSCLSLATYSSNPTMVTTARDLVYHYCFKNEYISNPVTPVITSTFCGYNVFCSCVSSVLKAQLTPILPLPVATQAISTDGSQSPMPASPASTISASPPTSLPSGTELPDTTSGASQQITSSATSQVSWSPLIEPTSTLPIGLSAPNSNSSPRISGTIIALSIILAMVVISWIIAGFLYVLRTNGKEFGWRHRVRSWLERLVQKQDSRYRDEEQLKDQSEHIERIAKELNLPILSERDLNRSSEDPMQVSQTHMTLQPPIIHLRTRVYGNNSSDSSPANATCGSEQPCCSTPAQRKTGFIPRRWPKATWKPSPSLGASLSVAASAARSSQRRTRSGSGGNPATR